MRKQWTAALGIFVLALAIGGRAEAANFADDACGVDEDGVTPGIQRIVDTPAEAALVGNGYNCPGVDLIIQIGLPIPDPSLPITAHDITIDPAGGPTPAVPVDIINTNPASEIRLTATETDINIRNARIKAHKLLRIDCTGFGPPACDLIVRLSELVATFDFAAPAPGTGDVKMVIAGDIDIQTSTVHGGARLEVTATFGSLTLLCTPGGGGCQDPLVSSTAVARCGTCPPGDTCPPDPRVPPVVTPCTTTFATETEITEFCIPVPGVSCDGGSVEKRFTACEDINITGSTITSVEHMTFETKGFKQDGTKCDGRLLAAGATLTSSTDSVVATIAGNGTLPSIDLSNATINSATHTTITAQPPATGAATGCPPLGPPDALIPPGPGLAYPSNVCINANGALIQASNIIMTAASGNGQIDLCGTAAAVAGNPPTRPPQVAGATLINDLGADFSTINGDSTGGPSPAAYSRVVAGVETILNGTVECTAPAVGKFGAYIDCSGAGGSCPPGIIDP